MALFQGGDGSKPSLVGIEEPEVALHPAAASVVRDALARASERSQVIVTSHSPELLDDQSIDLDSLLAVSAGDGATLIAPLDDASRETVRKGLFTPGELLVLNQLTPDPKHRVELESRQMRLFGADA